MKKELFIMLAVLSLVFSCSKDKEDPDIISLKVSEKTLYYGDEYQIEATSKAAITYVVKDEYHAKVSETGLVTARFIGGTIISLSNGEDSKTFRLIVNPKSNLYPEPNVMFGESKSDVIKKLGTPNSETTSGILLYNNYSSSAPILACAFDENDRLTSFSIMVKSAYSSNLGAFLSERYMIIELEDFTFANGLTSSTTTMLVKAELFNTQYWMVVYMPFSKID